MEKPILFNTEMVKAILEGRKTCTRRIIKRTPSNDEPCGYGFWKQFNERDNTWYVKDYTYSCTWWSLREYIKKFSKYHVGDILYVKETWRIQSMSNYDKRIKFMYRASNKKDLETRFFTNDRYEKLLKYENKSGWQPSIFMPKEAARIFLEVKEVRIERLQGLDYQGASSEGIVGYDGWTSKFKELWDNTLKKEQLDLYSWNRNPWVWVIDFKRIYR